MIGEQLLITEHIRKHAISRHAKIAAIDHGGEATYSELSIAITSVASALIDRGIGKGDIVATALVTSLPHVVVILGAMAAGAIPCITNTRLTTRELADFLSIVRPALIVADPENSSAVDKLEYPICKLGDANGRASLSERLAPLWMAPQPLPQLQETDFGLIIPTGGTTGTPKGAVATHRSLYLWTSMCCFNANRIPEDIELYFSPFFHVASIAGWMTTLFAGGTVRLLRKFVLDDVVVGISEGATVVLGVPSMFSDLRNHHAFAGLDRTSVRMISIGSTAISPQVIADVQRDFPGATLRHTYGATEFGACYTIPPSELRHGRTDGVGLPIQGVRATIVDDSLQPVANGEVGEIVVASPWQMSGYWGRPEETEAIFTPMGVRSGDLGRIDADGWLTIVGRKKEIIVTGGENVFPNEVETVLRRHPAVQDMSVYGVKDERWGERVEAAIVLREGHDLTLKALADYGRQQLAGYKLPKTLRILDAIPLTTNGKPDRLSLSREAETADCYRDKTPA